MYTVLIGENELYRITYSFPRMDVTYAFMISKAFRQSYNYVSKMESTPKITIIEYYEDEVTHKNKTLYSNLDDFYMHRKCEYSEFLNEKLN